MTKEAAVPSYLHPLAITDGTYPNVHPPNEGLPIGDAN